MTTLFAGLVLLLVILLGILVVADRRVTHAVGWEAIDRWLLAGSYAAPAAILVAGAAIGVALAWVVI